MLKKITLVFILAFIVIVSYYEISLHYNDPVEIVNKMPSFPVASDFKLHPSETNIVRMHIINVKQPSDILISRARRAVVERKNGVIYFDGKYDKSLLDETKKILEKIGFKIGKPRPFVIPNYINIIAGFVLVTFSIFFIDKRFVFLSFVPILGIWFNVNIYISYILIFTLPALWLPKNIKEYFISFLLILMAGMLIHFIYFQTPYVTGAKYPRGIKAILIIPILFLVYREKIRFKKEDMKIILILSILAFIYVIKSGNYIEPTNFERRIRDYMDMIFYVRPRFKEFLIGFPLLWIIVKYGAKNKFVKILSVLAYISIFDSFLHPYTDAILSAYRSSVSLILGIFIGELYYIIWRMYKRLIWKK